MGIPGVVDLGGKSADQVEREASALEPGWFRAHVHDVYDQDGTLYLVFRLTDGRQFTEKLWDPNSSDKPQKLQQRRDAFAIRLGLVPREAKGQAYPFDWLDAIGRECVLELALSKPNDKGQRFVNLTWMGLYEPNDSRVPAEIRAGGGSAPPKGDAPEGGTGAKKTAGTDPKPAPAAAGATRSDPLNLDDL